MRLLVVAAAALVLGVAIGRALPTKSPGPTLAAAPPAVTRCAMGMSQGEIDAVARAVVREIGTPSEASVSTTAPPATVEPAPTPPPSPAALAASGRASEILDRAVASGTWTIDDKMALRAVLADLTPDDRNATFAALARAVNEGRLALSGPPL